MCAIKKPSFFHKQTNKAILPWWNTIVVVVACCCRRCHTRLQFPSPSLLLCCIVLTVLLALRVCCLVVVASHCALFLLHRRTPVHHKIANSTAFHDSSSTQQPCMGGLDVCLFWQLLSLTIDVKSRSVLFEKQCGHDCNCHKNRINKKLCGTIQATCSRTWFGRRMQHTSKQ